MDSYFYDALIYPKDADGMANSVDPDQILIKLHVIANSAVPDQTAPKEQSDQGLHCLLRPVCSNI